jgi:hypothetical protein
LELRAPKIEFRDPMLVEVSLEFNGWMMGTKLRTLEVEIRAPFRALKV